MRESSPWAGGAEWRRVRELAKNWGSCEATVTATAKRRGEVSERRIESDDGIYHGMHSEPFLYSLVSLGGRKSKEEAAPATRSHSLNGSVSRSQNLPTNQRANHVHLEV